MANTFTPVIQTRLGGPVGKSLMLVEGTLVIDTTSSGGAAVDDMPASLFKLTKIIACLSVVNDGETAAYFGNPDYTGDSLLISDEDSATNGFQDLPNDTYKVTLLGIG